MKLYNSLALKKTGVIVCVYGFSLMLGGCVSNGNLLTNEIKNPDALSLTRMQTPSALKTYIYKKTGDGYWVDVSVDNNN